MFYEDEVDIHLNPKIGADWQVRGQQKRVVTPVRMENIIWHWLLHSSTGKVSYVSGSSKISVLFISQLKHLKATYRRAKTITLSIRKWPPGYRCDAGLHWSATLAEIERVKWLYSGHPGRKRASEGRLAWAIAMGYEAIRQRSAALVVHSATSGQL